MDMSGCSADANDQPGVLDRVIWIEQFCPNRAGLGAERMHQHLLDPVRRDDLDVIVQEKQNLR